MSMWQTIKRGFGYGLGGRIGWEAGGFLWGLITNWRRTAIIATGIFGVFGIQPLNKSIQEDKARAATEQARKPTTAVEARQAKPVKKSAAVPAEGVEAQFADSAAVTVKVEPWAACAARGGSHAECKKLDPSSKTYNMKTGAWE